MDNFEISFQMPFLEMPPRPITELNVLPEGWSVEWAVEFGNILGVSGDFLTPEQLAEIHAAFSGLPHDRHKRAIEITAAWLHTHHGMGLPNLDGIRQIEQHEFDSRP